MVGELEGVEAASFLSKAQVFPKSGERKNTNYTLLLYDSWPGIQVPPSPFCSPGPPLHLTRKPGFLLKVQGQMNCDPEFSLLTLSISAASSQGSHMPRLLSVRPVACDGGEVMLRPCAFQPQPQPQIGLRMTAIAHKHHLVYIMVPEHYKKLTTSLNSSSGRSCGPQGAGRPLPWLSPSSVHGDQGCRSPMRALEYLAPGCLEQRQH